MNPDNILNDTISLNTAYQYDPNTLTISTASISGSSISNVINDGYGSIAMDVLTDELLDKYELNKVTADHKVTDHELLKLKEVAPDYGNEIKENLTKTVARDIIKKMSFTKRHDKETDVHHFIGRVWVFTEDELKNLIKEVKNA